MFYAHRISQLGLAAYQGLNEYMHWCLLHRDSEVLDKDFFKEKHSYCDFYLYLPYFMPRVRCQISIQILITYLIIVLELKLRALYMEVISLYELHLSRNVQYLLIAEIRIT